MWTRSSAAAVKQTVDGLIDIDAMPIRLRPADYCFFAAGLTKQLASQDERAHDINTHFYRARAVQDARCHDGSMLRKSDHRMLAMRPAPRL
jgi:hypothetical protein